MPQRGKACSLITAPTLDGYGGMGESALVHWWAGRPDSGRGKVGWGGCYTNPYLLHPTPTSPTIMGVYAEPPSPFSARSTLVRCERLASPT